MIEVAPAEVLDAADAPVVVAPECPPGHGLYRQGSPLDHFSLFAADVTALEELRDRLVARGMSDGHIEDIAGNTTRFAVIGVGVLGLLALLFWLIPRLLS